MYEKIKKQIELQQNKIDNLQEQLNQARGDGDTEKASAILYLWKNEVLNMHLMEVLYN